jgi:hypothetical protein
MSDDIIKSAIEGIVIAVSVMVVIFTIVALVVAYLLIFH